jgi:hypothetical protein
MFIFNDASSYTHTWRHETKRGFNGSTENLRSTPPDADIILRYLTSLPPSSWLTVSTCVESKDELSVNGLHRLAPLLRSVFWRR